ncbi:Hypothetical predicted protein [Pelobates cultripes]|uniref:Uncharacterized protein n=1 Tax=Pelobates cultripes TaxID=61616 RepID=A0AAD1TFQ1_PELCU|nr:Hypothetical predicted protein [Pelobates cultripes]
MILCPAGYYWLAGPLAASPPAEPDCVPSEPVLIVRLMERNWNSKAKDNEVLYCEHQSDILQAATNVSCTSGQIWNLMELTLRKYNQINTADK